MKAERTSLLLDCSIIERKCPLFPYARPCAAKPPDLLDAVYHHTMRRGATFDTGALVVENACFEKRVRTVPPCEIPSSLSTYAAWLGLDALSEAHGWTGRPDLDRYPSTRDALKESECSGSPACRRAVGAANADAWAFADAVAAAGGWAAHVQAHRRVWCSYARKCTGGELVDDVLGLVVDFLAPPGGS